jgi:hypothetical protein
MLMTMVRKREKNFKTDEKEPGKERTYRTFISEMEMRKKAKNLKKIDDLSIKTFYIGNIVFIVGSCLLNIIVFLAGIFFQVLSIVIQVTIFKWTKRNEVDNFDHRSPIRISNTKKNRETLPARPGSIVLKDNDGFVIFMGVANNLKKRVDELETEIDFSTIVVRMI